MIFVLIAQDYKPRPRVYQASAEAFDLKPSECMMVSAAAHDDDTAGAAKTGLRTQRLRALTNLALRVVRQHRRFPLISSPMISTILPTSWGPDSANRRVRTKRAAQPNLVGRLPQQLRQLRHVGRDPPRLSRNFYNDAGACLRLSSDKPILKAFCRVAPSVRFKARAIFAAWVLLRASLFNLRISSVVHARLLFFISLTSRYYAHLNELFNQTWSYAEL
jgi:hypothetical protein